MIKYLTHSIILILENFTSALIGRVCEFAIRCDEGVLCNVICNSNTKLGSKVQHTGPCQQVNRYKEPFRKFYMSRRALVAPRTLSHCEQKER